MSFDEKTIDSKTGAAQTLENVTVRPSFQAQPSDKLADKPPQSSDVAQVKTVKGSDAYHEALLKEPVSLRSGRSMLLMACLLLGCFCQTMSTLHN